MLSFDAYKLTLIKRIFYVYPKDFIFFVYFNLLKNRKHLRYLFRKLILDAAYVIKYRDAERAPVELQDTYLDMAKVSDWWQKDFYDKKEFHWKMVCKFVEKLRVWIREKQPATVLDIGCANGGRLDLLAEEFPHIQFIGIDFTTTEAVKNNRYPNITYHEGYPLDVMRQLSGPIDMVFSTQSLLHALPRELDAYFERCAELQVKHVAIFDTNVNGYVQKNDGTQWSKHMGYHLAWCHNYSGYMQKYGFEVRHFERAHCDFHPSRSDLYFVHVLGEKGSVAPSATVSSTASGKESLEREVKPAVG